jgi:hypothetical protein
VLLTVFRLFFSPTIPPWSCPRLGHESTASLCRLPIAKAGTFGFFDSDRTRRAGGPKTLEDRNIFEMMIRRSFGEITLELTAEQFARLNR